MMEIVAMIAIPYDGDCYDTVLADARTYLRSGVVCRAVAAALMKREFSRVVIVAVQVCCGDYNQGVVVGLIRSLRVFVVPHSY